MSELRPPRPEGKNIHWLDGQWVELPETQIEPIDMGAVRKVQARRTELIEELMTSMADSIDLMGEMSRTHVLPDGRIYKLTVGPA